MSRAPAAPAEIFVARWHSDEGCFVVLAALDARSLRVLVQGHPCELKKLDRREEKHLLRLDYPVKKAARSMRRFARNNAGGRARRFLEEVIAGASA